MRFTQHTNGIRAKNKVFHRNHTLQTNAQILVVTLFITPIHRCHLTESLARVLRVEQVHILLLCTHLFEGVVRIQKLRIDVGRRLVVLQITAVPHHHLTHHKDLCRLTTRSSWLRRLHLKQLVEDVDQRVIVCGTKHLRHKRPALCHELHC